MSPEGASFQVALGRLLWVKFHFTRRGWLRVDFCGFGMLFSKTALQEA